MSFSFPAIPELPPDPIFGVDQAFRADTRKKKLNLSVGYYYDDAGIIPVLDSVQRAASACSMEDVRGYLPIDGHPQFIESLMRQVLGDDLAESTRDRIVAIQSPGGTGALRLAFEFSARILGSKQLWLPDPTWENHLTVGRAAGLELQSYPYWNGATHSIDVERSVAGLAQAKPFDVVLFHACCHNPTGLDPSTTEWASLLKTVAERQALPLIDAAYLGFRKSFDEDCSLIRKLVASGAPCAVAVSCSKNFSLYAQRLGLLLFVLPESSARARARSQFVRIIRSMYSNPPVFGALLVSRILGDATLRKGWLSELDTMRARLGSIRAELTASLAKKCGDSFAHLASQSGLFSYSGLTKPEVARLKEEFGIYLLDSGRMCVAALNESNLPQLIEAISAVRGAS